MGWVLPVGVPGGIVSGCEGIPDGSGIVQLGGEGIQLDQARYQLWREASRALQSEELLQWAEENDVPNAAGSIRTLKDVELLIEERSNPSLQAGRLVVHFTGDCVGNVLSDGRLFGMTGLAGIQIEVDVFIYDVLLHSNGCDSLSQVCDALDRSRSDIPPGFGIDRFFRVLPVLVRSGICRLNRVMQ